MCSLHGTLTQDCHGKSSIQQERFFTGKLNLNFRKKLLKLFVMIVDYYGAEILTLRKFDQKYLAGFEMWCWRRMEICWTYRVKKLVLH